MGFQIFKIQIFLTYFGVFKSRILSGIFEHGSIFDIFECNLSILYLF